MRGGAGNGWCPVVRLHEPPEPSDGHLVLVRELDGGVADEVEDVRLDPAAVEDEWEGDELVGGSVNVESPLQLTIDKVGQDTLVSAIVRLLDRAQSERPRVARLADRVAGWFVGALLIIAAAVALLAGRRAAGDGASGRGGVGIIRISGENLDDISDGMIGALPEPRRAAYRRFRDASGEIIDEGLALYFPAPHSFTGEEVLELQGHGGPIILDMLMERVLELGARPARPD